MVALVVASFALVASGCGGDDGSASGSPVDEWATGFCTAVTGWTGELQQIENDFTTDPGSFADADALKDAVESVSSATDDFVADVRALGAPDTESGEEVRSSLDDLAETLETEKADIEQAAEDVSGLTDLPAAITSIGTSLSAMGAAFQTALEALESADVKGELEDALESSDACAELTS